jgi:hypothetical protein
VAWAVTGAALAAGPALVAVALGNAGCGGTTSLAAVRVCAKVDADGVCPADTEELPAAADTIHATAVLQNAPPDTAVTVSWRYLEAEGGFDIDAATFVARERLLALHGVLTRPDHGWPPGRYEVVLAVGVDGFEPVRKPFRIP